VKSSKICALKVEMYFLEYGKVIFLLVFDICKLDFSYFFLPRGQIRIRYKRVIITDIDLTFEVIGYRYGSRSAILVDSFTFEYR